MLYRHVPHEHIARRADQGPVRVGDQARKFNSRLGLAITAAIGTMWAAYAFALVALISLPSAIGTHNLTVIIAWISSNFVQLVLLPVIIVGQNIQAAASDKRAEQTYKDAEAVLAETLKIQEHLAVQDAILEKLTAAPSGGV